MRLMVVMLAAIAFAVAGCGGSTASEPDARVLFVGNSFTFQNDVPGMVEQIADANGSSLETRMIASGGRFLDEHAEDSAVVEAVSSGEYDVVVLQEQSMAPAHGPTYVSRTVPAVATLDGLADASGTVVVLYQTWGHLDGNSTIGQPSYTSMQNALIESYDDLGRRTGASVAPVGERWMSFMAGNTTARLHASDGSHATPAGSYLAALVLAQWVATAPILEAPAVGDVDQALADQLFAAA